MSTRVRGRTTFVEVAAVRRIYEPVPDKLYGGQDWRRKVELELELVVLLFLWLLLVVVAASERCY